MPGRGVKLRREKCSICDRNVAVQPNGAMVRHRSPELHGLCPGSLSGSFTPQEPDPISRILATAVEWPDRRPEEWLAQPLPAWWLGLAEQDLAGIMPKVHEYSAYDLELMGRGLADMIGFDIQSAPGSAAHPELACWFYLLGKVSRAIGAIKEGRLPSDDTVTDTRIYATMIARIRRTGAWPGLATTEEK